ncbi:hypothetical protein [Bosea sp. ANAM02]|uniref:hypothetical protein n=1 Tax=Bosea sp. ANAM02 TaxID=2020412 RepID=UPI00140EA8B6|nr:hypothetical protein [Bosea sp. ANAM02]BCB21952.1 hypothetical protein OCUBac02_48460 [Bosea sp. ANAM02]
MPFFHATFRKHLNSIRRHGLGADGHGTNWPGCAAGVYLAAHPAICVSVMLEHYLAYGDPSSVPSEHLDEICVIVVDDSRVRSDRLLADPQTSRSDSFVYSGVIDISGLPVLGVEEALAV